ncbi:MAG TPA: DNA recombination protein RmuC [Saprospiraceae bacterium]|nr:DNA recombination protein RmuC [Saprospiraceae bacterium]HMP26188.1 DNA recombination protein RmuC [Saprospiraceae bacterium]
MSETLLLLSILLSLLVGGLVGWLIAKVRLGAGQLSQEAVERRYVTRELHAHLQTQLSELQDFAQQKQEELRQLSAALAGQERDVEHWRTQLATQQEAIEALQERARLEFRNLAQQLLEEKSAKFTAQNQQQMQDLLFPLREKIKDFEESIERKFIDEAKDRISLKTEIEQLRQLNQQLSRDANNLADALKGDSKSQGDWGEFRLELLLEKAGLTKNIHYRTQASFTDTDGQQKRPDFIIHLPDDKHLVIDSKVSLTAFEQFFNCEDEHDRRRHLKAHVESIRRHIKDLSDKNYQHLYQINSPDYLLLFIPLEPAFAVAAQHDNALFLDALDKNIVIVTTTTLLATMRTVSYIWKQEKQKHNVLEIARQSGLLYDKFCAFVEDLRTIGQRLDHAQSAYQDAMNKLVESRKFGDTLVGRAEKIKELGAKTSRQLPRDLIEQSSQE